MEALEKADPALRAALFEGNRGGELRVIFTLQRAPAEGAPPVEVSHGPFTSRKQMRSALIEAQERRAEADYAATINALRGLGLWVAGGNLAGAVVVEGTPGQLRAALRLTGVRAAALDRPIALRVRSSPTPTTLAPNALCVVADGADRERRAERRSARGQSGSVDATLKAVELRTNVNIRNGRVVENREAGVGQLAAG